MSAPRQTNEPGEDGLDHAEKAGFLIGKDAAIVEWRHRRETAEYKALFRRLYARNYQRLRREQDPEGERARVRAWRAAHHDELRDREREARRAARLAELRALGATFRVEDGVAVRTYWIVCAVCLAEVEKDKPNARYCSKRCSNQWHGVPRARARNRGVRNTVLAATARTILEIEPWLTLAEILERSPTPMKYGSLATWLSTETKAGRVERRPDGRAGRYALTSTDMYDKSETKDE